MEYKLLYGSTSKDLSEEVNKALADGYVLYRGPSCSIAKDRYTNYAYIQAVVKFEDKEEPNYKISGGVL